MRPSRLTSEEDGCLWVYGVSEDGVPAFTQDGIENLRQIIADRAAGRHRSNPPCLRSSPHGNLQDRLAFKNPAFIVPGDED